MRSVPMLILVEFMNSSCLEWRYTYPLLENAGLETWAVDILGWGFSDLGTFNEIFIYIYLYIYMLPENP